LAWDELTDQTGSNDGNGDERRKMLEFILRSALKPTMPQQGSDAAPGNNASLIRRAGGMSAENESSDMSPSATGATPTEPTGTGVTASRPETASLLGSGRPNIPPRRTVEAPAPNISLDSNAPRLLGRGAPDPSVPLLGRSKAPGPPTARENYEALREQGPPQYHGFNKFLDILGTATNVGRDIEMGTGMGSLGYKSRLSSAQRAAQSEIGDEKEQAGLALTKAQTDEATARATSLRNPKPEKPESLTNEEAQAVEDLVTQGVKRVDAIAQVKSAGQKPEKQTFEEQSYAEWAKEQKAAGKPSDRMTYQKELKAAERAPERPQRTLVAVPQPGGGSKIIEATAGTVIPKGAQTVSEFGKEQTPTPDEQRRADLGNNLNENLDRLEEIVKRRPDLFGPAAGRLTSAKQWLGTSDPDVAALDNIKEQVGLAMVGAHAMRNAQHAEKAAACPAVTVWFTGCVVIVGVTAAALSVKFTPVTLAPLTAILWLLGIKVKPAWLGATAYVPFGNPENM